MAKEFKAGAASRASRSIAPADGTILDVGPGVEAVGADRPDQTLVWNGRSAQEIEPFDKATVAAAKRKAKRTRAGALVSVAGGGDTVAALNLWLTGCAASPPLARPSMVGRAASWRGGSDLGQSGAGGGKIHSAVPHLARLRSMSGRASARMRTERLLRRKARCAVRSPAATGHRSRARRFLGGGRGRRQHRGLRRALAILIAQRTRRPRRARRASIPRRWRDPDHVVPNLPHEDWTM